MFLLSHATGILQLTLVVFNNNYLHECDFAIDCKNFAFRLRFRSFSLIFARNFENFAVVRPMPYARNVENFALVRPMPKSSFLKKTVIITSCLNLKKNNATQFGR